jgi:cytochrome o ubiquinol oxidase subunit 3
MTQAHAATHNIDHAQIDRETYSKTVFGFWVYLMTDCILFATLFATYAVLHPNIAGGPSSKEIFSLPYVLVETIILLTSSFTSGMGVLAVHKRNANHTLKWFGVTFALGILFLVMELSEFSELVHQGHSWKQSAFLSSYFTLVGTHGLHIASGLLWMAVMFGQLLTRGINIHVIRRLTCLGLFWHFLDVVWIFIFTFVYLMGVI